MLYETTGEERSNMDQDYVDHLIKHDDMLITLRGNIVKPSYPTHPNYSESKIEVGEEQDNEIYLGIHAHRLIAREKFDQDHDVFSKIPPEIKMADMLIYGESLAQCVLAQMVGIELDALWTILSYIMQEMDTVDVLCLLDNPKTWGNLLRVQNIDNLDLLLTTIIESSTYSIATALYLRYLICFLYYLFE